MKRYGQQTITLKDMLVELLLEHMDDGKTFKQLKKELGASEFGLKLVIEKMERDGELIRIRRPVPEAAIPPELINGATKIDMGNGQSYSVGISVDEEIDCLSREEEVRQRRENRPLIGGLGATKMSGTWAVTRNDEAFKLSPRMWIEVVAEA